MNIERLKYFSAGILTGAILLSMGILVVFAIVS